MTYIANVNVSEREREFTFAKMHKEISSIIVIACMGFTLVCAYIAADLPTRPTQPFILSGPIN